MPSSSRRSPASPSLPETSATGSAGERGPSPEHDPTGGAAAARGRAEVQPGSPVVQPGGAKERRRAQPRSACSQRTPLKPQLTLPTMRGGVRLPAPWRPADGGAGPSSYACRRARPGAPTRSHRRRRATGEQGEEQARRHRQPRAQHRTAPVGAPPGRLLADPGRRPSCGRVRDPAPGGARCRITFDVYADARNDQGQRIWIRREPSLDTAVAWMVQHSAELIAFAARSRSRSGSRGPAETTAAEHASADVDQARELGHVERGQFG